jgi:phosphatidylglycerol:prolipoprotein diacylglycerol transferase
MADTACLGLVLGQIIGRWGNFFNREAFGGVATDKSLFAMRIYFDDWYSSSQVPETVAKGMYEMTGKTIQQLGYIQVQPTFLYESLWNLCLLILILIIGKKKKFDGQVFFTYVLGYGLGRVWIEGLRTDQLLIPVVNFPVSQVLSAILILVSGGFLIYGFKKAKN